QFCKADGTEGEKKAGETMSRETDENTDDEAHAGRNRERPTGRPTVGVHEDRGRVAAEAEERRMSDRDLSGEADQQVQRQGRQSEHGDVGQLAVLVGLQRPKEWRQRDVGDRQCADRPQRPVRRAPLVDADRLEVHTRSTRREPNKPLGRNNNTMRMMIRLSEPFSSWPMTSGW